MFEHSCEVFETLNSFVDSLGQLLALILIALESQPVFIQQKICFIHGARKNLEEG